MKKIIAMLVACLMVLALVPVIAAPAAAAEKVVYVGKDGTGDGSAADKPMGDLVAAFAAIGDEDGTIVLVNMYESKVEHKIAPHAGNITVTSKYNGVDYKGGIYASATAHLHLGGGTTFENLTINLKSTWVWRILFNHLTMGEGVNVTNDAGTFPQLFLVGADQNSSSACDPSKDTHITLKSGRYYEVVGAARSGFPGDITAKVIVEVTGDTEIGKLAFGTRALANKVNLGDALVVLDGGVINTWVSAGDKLTTGFQGKVQVVLTKNFDISKSFNTAERTTADANNGPIFNGLSGASAFADHIAVTRLGTAELLVDPSIKAAIDASDKILKDSFNEIKEYTYTGTIGSGKLEAAPVVTEPVTTEAVTTAATVDTTAATVDTTAAVVDTTAAVVDTTAATGEVTPPTGDASLMIVFAAAVVLCATAVVVIKKREN